MSNGRLNTSELTVIPGGRLRDDAAKAWLAMRGDILYRGGPGIMPGGPDSSYRSYARQVYWRNYWTAKGQPYKAAIPGTSNHGWGLAVDVLSLEQQRWIMKIGKKYGWSHDEGAKVGEPWHFTFIGRKEWLTQYEQQLIDEYIKLKIENRNRLRRRKLRALMRKQRRKIRRSASKTGWRMNHRLERSRQLRRYS